METIINQKKSFFYPPGGLLLWIIIYVELLTFGMGIAAVAYYGSLDRTAFHQDSLQLNKSIATLNTLLLLTSGYFVVKAVQDFKAALPKKCGSQLLWAAAAGLGFLVLKMLEYSAKIEAGLDMNYSTFFMFYWLLTGFHWIHVLVGVVILLILRFQILKKPEELKLEDLEGGAAFWHMCDLIWLLLFPVLYLIM